MERYEKYIQKLQAKVEKQREDRKISDEEFLRRIKAQDEVGNRKIGNGYRRQTIPMEDIGVGGVGNVKIGNKYRKRMIPMEGIGVGGVGRGGGS